MVGVIYVFLEFFLIVAGIAVISTGIFKSMKVSVKNNEQVITHSKLIIILGFIGSLLIITGLLMLLSTIF